MRKREKAQKFSFKRKRPAATDTWQFSKRKVKRQVPSATSTCPFHLKTEEPLQHACPTCSKSSINVVPRVKAFQKKSVQHSSLTAPSMFAPSEFLQQS
jgi:hypothetical protein